MKKTTDFLDKFNNFKVSKYAKFTFVVPAVIVLIAIILIVSLGATTNDFSGAVGIGIDFEGGTIMYITLGDGALGDKYDVNSKKIRDAIQKEGVVVSYIQRQEDDAEAKSAIVFRYKNKAGASDEQIAETNDKIIENIKALYPDKDGEFVRYESIGATAAQDLLSKAAIAIVVSTLLILIYIMIRFTFISGVAAVLALIHDVLLLFCLTVICRIQINTSFVAAVITIIAYSINNTIIIFDRCRETLKPMKGMKNIDYATIGDTAVRNTMSRSIYTTLTTMITIIFLAILGSDTIREFCVPIILGLIAGLYSSVFLATPLWAAMSTSFDKTKEKYQSRHEVKYEKKEDADLTVNKPANVEDSESTFEPKQNVKVAKKAQNKPNNVIHKYTKKNTTFKKK